MPLHVQLDYDLGVPIFRQVQDAVASALATGDLAPDEQLPTIHALAARLDINLNTVIRAYQELEHAGLVVAERGRGTFPVKRRDAPTDKTKVLRKILKRAFDQGAKATGCLVGLMTVVVLPYVAFMLVVDQLFDAALYTTLTEGVAPGAPPSDSESTWNVRPSTEL